MNDTDAKLLSELCTLVEKLANEGLVQVSLPIKNSHGRITHTFSLEIESENG